MYSLYLTDQDNLQFPRIATVPQPTTEAVLSPHVIHGAAVVCGISIQLRPNKRVFDLQCVE